MAKYFARQPCYVGEGVTAVFYPANSKFTIPDTVQPSRTWTPLDPPAKKALERLGVNREIGEEQEVVEPDTTPVTMSETQRRVPGRPVPVRPSDRQ